DKDWRSAGSHDLPCAGDDRERRHDHFVTFADVQRLHSSIQRGSSVAHGDPVLAAQPCGELLFELRDERPLGRDPSGVNALTQVRFLVAIQQWRIDWNDRLVHAKSSRSRINSPGTGSNRVLSWSPQYGPCFTSMISVGSSISKP